MRNAILICTMLLTVSTSFAQRTYPSITVSTSINSTLSAKESFEYIVPMDLEHIFEPYKNIPGIDSTSNT